MFVGLVMLSETKIKAIQKILEENNAQKNGITVEFILKELPKKCSEPPFLKAEVIYYLSHNHYKPSDAEGVWYLDGKKPIKLLIEKPRLVRTKEETQIKKADKGISQNKVKITSWDWSPKELEKELQIIKEIIHQPFCKNGFKSNMVAAELKQRGINRTNSTIQRHLYRSWCQPDNKGNWIYKGEELFAQDAAALLDHVCLSKNQGFTVNGKHHFIFNVKQAAICWVSTGAIYSELQLYRLLKKGGCNYTGAAFSRLCEVIGFQFDEQGILRLPRGVAYSIPSDFQSYEIYDTQDLIKDLVKERFYKKDFKTVDIKKILKDHGEKLSKTALMTYLYQAGCRLSKKGMWRYDMECHDFSNNIIQLLQRIKKSQAQNFKVDQEPRFIFTTDQAVICWASTGKIKTLAQFVKCLQQQGFQTRTSSVQAICQRLGIYQDDQGIYRLPRYAETHYVVPRGFKTYKSYLMDQFIDDYLKTGKVLKQTDLMRVLNDHGFECTPRSMSVLFKRLQIVKSTEDGPYQRALGAKPVRGSRKIEQKTVVPSSNKKTVTVASGLGVINHDTMQLLVTQTSKLGQNVFVTARNFKTISTYAFYTKCPRLINLPYNADNFSRYLMVLGRVSDGLGEGIFYQNQIVHQWADSYQNTNTLTYNLSNFVREADDAATHAILPFTHTLSYAASVPGQLDHWAYKKAQHITDRDIPERLNFTTDQFYAYQAMKRLEIANMMRYLYKDLHSRGDGLKFPPKPPSQDGIEIDYQNLLYKSSILAPITKSEPHDSILSQRP